MMRIRVFLFLSLLMISVTGWGQSIDSGASSDTIDLIYDPTQIVVEQDAGQKLLASLMDQVTESQKKQESYFVPIAPASKEELEPFSKLKIEEMETFLAKKQKFMEKISHGLQWLRLPISLHNKAMMVINQHFFAAAPTIAKANSSGVAVRVQVGGGIGLRNALTEKFAKLPGMSWYPKSGGFYVALGFGFAVRKADVTSGGGWSFEVFMDIDSLKSVKTFLGTVGIDGNVLYTVDDIRLKNRVSAIGAEVMGPLGTLRLSDSHFSVGPGVGLTFPPIVDKAMFYSLQERRIVLLNLDLQPVGEFIKGVFKGFSQQEFAGGPLCSNVFN